VNTIYLGAMLFGVVLFAGSIVLGGKELHHGGGHDADVGIGWAPIASIRFWIFLLTFGGAVGLAVNYLEDNEALAAGGAIGVGWVSGVLAVGIIRKLAKSSASSEVAAKELVGATGTLLLPVGVGKPGKVRLDVGGRIVDFVAHGVDDTPDLGTGSEVLIVGPGAAGSVVVAKSVA
jgi:hypothetical protein